MELPDIGQQCSHQNCKQLDFLPLKCKCGQQFCTEHFNSHVKDCEVFIRSETELKTFKNIYKCAEEGCPETSLVPIICERCQKNFCVKHRHLTQCKEKTGEELAAEKEKYAAPIRQFNEAKGVVDKQIEKTLDNARKKGRNLDMANKVQLMKIKNKATGLKTIPICDRVYFNVFNSNNTHPVFVSKNWSIGRSIDAIADECKLQNNNNKLNEKKLRLFIKNTGEMVSKNMSESIQDLINNKIIVDGENLTVDYVNENV